MGETKKSKPETSCKQSIKIFRTQDDIICEAVNHFDQRISFCLVVSAAIIGALISTNIVVTCNIISIMCYIFYLATWILLIICNSMFLYSITKIRCNIQETNMQELTSANYNVYNQKKKSFKISALLLVASIGCCFLFLALKPFI